MLNKTIYLLTFLFFIQTIFCNNSNNIIDLTENNYNSALVQYQNLFVLFHDHSEDLSHKLLAEFQKSVNTFKKTNSNSIGFAKINCSADYGKRICMGYAIPSLRIFKDGKINGKCKHIWETNGINDCIQNEVFPNCRQYHTFNEMYTELANSSDVIVLGIFRGQQPSTIIGYDTIQDQFFKAVHSLGDSVQFRHININSLPNVYDFDMIRNLKDYSLPYVLLIRPKYLWNRFETKFVVHSFGDIEDFIKLNYYGLVGLRTTTALDYFKFPIINIYSVIDYENQLKHTIEIRNQILELSYNHKDIQFIISDANKFSDELIKYHGFQTLPQILNSVPIVTAQDVNHMRFLMNENQFSYENLSKFIINMNKQKLKTILKSEDMVNIEPLKEYSAQEFEELVFNSRKDSFVMFYIQDCDYCKRLEKTFGKLAKILEHEQNLTIIKQEFVGEYFAEHFKSDTFPTFYWIDRNKQKYLYYGRNELSDFIEFIAENSSDELKNYDRLGRLKHIKYEL